MPVRQGQDSKGKYYQWGSQKKYYYSDESTRKKAKRKAIIQGEAIKHSMKKKAEDVIDMLYQGDKNIYQTIMDKYKTDLKKGLFDDPIKDVMSAKDIIRKAVMLHPRYWENTRRVFKPIFERIEQGLESKTADEKTILLKNALAAIRNKDKKGTGKPAKDDITQTYHKLTRQYRPKLPYTIPLHSQIWFDWMD